MAFSLPVFAMSFQEAPFVVISLMGTVDKSDHILALTCKYSCYKT